MEKEKIIDYIKKRKMITLPALQKRFSLPYNQVKAIVAELVEDEMLVFASGITYNVREKPRLFQTAGAKPGQKYSLSEYMRMRSLLRSEENEDKDDDSDGEDDEDTEDDEGDEETPFDDLDLDDLLDCDDDDDDEEDAEDAEDAAYDRLIESLREEEARADESEDDCDDGIRLMRERIGNLGKLFNIKKIFNDSISLRCDSRCVDNKMCNVITLNGEQFKLDYDEGYLQITYDGFKPADSAIAKRADSIIGEYKSLHYKADAIVASVENTVNALDALAELYAAVERIKHGD